MPTPTATVMIPYHALDDLIQTGTRASQPAAADVTPGTLYSVSDEAHRLERSDGTAWALYSPTGGGSTASFSFDYSSTTVAPPTSSQVRFNALHPYTAVTTVWLRPVTTDGADIHTLLLLIPTGSTVYVQDKNDHTLYARFTTTAAPVDQTTYVTVPVAWVSNGGALLNNQAVEVLIVTGAGASSVAAHHTTHETGGSDAVTALSAAVLTTGTVPDARLSANVARRDQTNQFAGALYIDQYTRFDIGGTLAATDPKLYKVSDGVLGLALADNSAFATLKAKLDAADVVSGVLPDARLSANVARRDQANTFTQDQRVDAGKAFYLNESAAPANLRLWQMLPATQQLHFAAVDDAVTVASGQVFINRAGSLATTADFYEKNRTTPLGHWTAVAFNPANFTVTPSGTISVTQMIRQAYTLIGKTMIYQVYFYATLTGSPTTIRIALPPGIQTADYAATACLYSAVAGMMQVSSNDVYVNIFRDPSGLTAWVAGAYYIVGTLPFQIL